MADFCAARRGFVPPLPWPTFSPPFSARTSENLSPSEYAAAVASFGLPQPFADILADSYAGAAKGARLDDGRQLSTLIGLPNGSLADPVAAALKA